LVGQSAERGKGTDQRRFDAVLTMYHDRVNIAMKLIGFDRGVTLISFLLPIRDMADAR